MEIIGKVLGMNSSDGMINVAVSDPSKQIFNIKCSHEAASMFKIGRIYKFNVDQVFGERISYQLINAYDAENLDSVETDKILRSFLNTSPLSLEESKEKVYEYIEAIENDIIKAITMKLVKDYENKFFIYPAASKMHHSYVGGLAYHSIGMLKMADSFILNYPYLNKDYLYAGIILHDIGKIAELSGPQNTEYTLDGQLLGHLVIGALEIARVANELRFNGSKEVLLLEHMLVSHHGQPLFGAAKKPATPEALVLWYIDTIDSKFRVLGEELEKTNSGSFTDHIGVLDKSKIYKV